MAQEPSPGKPPHRFTPKHIEAVMSEAETLLGRLHLTPREMHVLSMAMTCLLYQQLAARKGTFYDIVYAAENRLN